MIHFTTLHLSEPGQSLAKVAPGDLAAEERRLVLEGSLGYCRTHGNLYRKVTPERMHELLEKHGMTNAFTECPALAIACKCKTPDPSHGIHVSQIGKCEEL